MKVYYKDIVNDIDEWSHLEIQVDKNIKPGLRLYAGGNQRFKLASSNRVHFWGGIEEGYYGAWMLYNTSEIALEDMPIPPIKASILQMAPLLNEGEKFSFWAKYFTNTISTSQNSLFHTGKWKISCKLSLNRLLKSGLYSKQEATEIQQGFYDTNPLFLDWGISGNFTIVAMKNEPHSEASNVKRWRKEVRNGTCPPILVWYVSCLSAYVIVDGHSRLKAFHCENKTPDIMVLESVIESERKPDLKAGESTIRNLEIRKKDKWKAPLSVEEMNNLLISVFDNRPYQSSVSRSLARSTFDTEWLEEVNLFKNHKDIDQGILEDMIFG